MELWSSLGLCSYYMRFIHRFTDTAVPLHRLLEKGQCFEWTPKAEELFQLLKQKLTQTPILGCPLLDSLSILNTDVSGFALGAALSQYQQGQGCLIAYYQESDSAGETVLHYIQGRNSWQ